MTDQKPLQFNELRSGFLLAHDPGAERPSTGHEPGTVALREPEAVRRGRNSVQAMKNRGDNESTMRSRQAGFGLVELVVALAVSSVGAVALAGAGLAIGEQSRTARWSADQGLVARSALETAHLLGQGAVPAGSSTIGTGARSYAVRTVVTPVGPRLDAVRLVVSEPGRPSVSYETRVASARPLPVAP